MSWIFGGWPPPPPGAGGVTFAAVQSALNAATGTVGFNSQPLTSVASLNGLELAGEPTNDLSMRIGATGAGLSTTLNRIAIGRLALNVSVGGDNLAIGNSSQALGSTGTSNTSVGHGALALQTSATGNTAVGAGAGPAVTTGFSNVLLGRGTAALLTTGATNLVAGDLAAAALTTGGANVLLGANTAPALAAGTSNVVIGAGAGVGFNATATILIGGGVTSPDLTTNFRMNIGGAIFGDLTAGAQKIRIGGSGTITTQTEVFDIVNAGADTVPALALDTQGAQPGKTFFYAGNRDPNGAVSAPGGSVYFRVSGATSGMYVNRTAGTGTSWSLVTAVP